MNDALAIVSMCVPSLVQLHRRHSLFPSIPSSLFFFLNLTHIYKTPHYNSNGSHITHTYLVPLSVLLVVAGLSKIKII